jgi:hypothetical protein
MAEWIGPTLYGAGQIIGGMLADAAPTAMAASSVASAGMGAYGMMNSPKAPGAPTQTDYAKEQEAAATAQAEALLKRRGMSSTILTSPLGAGGAQTGKATLGA